MNKTEPDRDAIRARVEKAKLAYDSIRIEPGQDAADDGAWLDLYNTISDCADLLAALARAKAERKTAENERDAERQRWMDARAREIEPESAQARLRQALEAAKQFYNDCEFIGETEQGENAFCRCCCNVWSFNDAATKDAHELHLPDCAAIKFTDALEALDAHRADPLAGQE